MGGTLAGTDSWFSQSVSQVSSHYGIGLDGTTHQYVSLEQGAWANGILEPGNKWFGTPGVSPNKETVSIETEDAGNPQQAVTDAEYASVLAVCRRAMAQYPSIRTLIGHAVISPHSRANCPGDRWRGRFGRLAMDLGIQGMQS